MTTLFKPQGMTRIVLAGVHPMGHPAMYPALRSESCSVRRHGAMSGPGESPHEPGPGGRKQHNDADGQANVLALIPARGGSKGVPRKNLRLLDSKPLIAHSIDVARRSRMVSRVVVSTDDPRIAEIARDAGAEAPFLRPAELAHDKAPLQGVGEHAMTVLSSQGWRTNVLVTLLPTHPFRTPALVDHLVGKALQGFSPVITVRAITRTESGFVFEDGNRLARLARPFNSGTAGASFHRTYGLVICQIPNVSGQGYMYSIKNPVSLIDLDYEQDFHLAEAVLKAGLFDFVHSEDPGGAP